MLAAVNPSLSWDATDIFAENIKTISIGTEIKVFGVDIEMIANAN